MGSIAHELGTPLNSALGYSQLLELEDLSPDARENLTNISIQIQRMIAIIKHYLGRTRDRTSDHRPLLLNTLIANTLHLLNPQFVQHQIAVTATLAEDLPVLHGDSAALQRVLVNLLNNALDAMDKGGQLHISTRFKTPPEIPQPGIQIDLCDTGSGIPPEVLPTIFEPLVTTKAPGKGTGLGLAICQEIVRSHRGTISVESEVGKGTCVHIFLPTISDTETSAPREDNNHEPSSAERA
jgi:signal transduction histidine kinase